MSSTGRPSSGPSTKTSRPMPPSPLTRMPGPPSASAIAGRWNVLRSRPSLSAGDVARVGAVRELVLDRPVLAVDDDLTERGLLRELLGVLDGEVLVVPGAQLALVLVTAGAGQRPAVHIRHDMEDGAVTHAGLLERRAFGSIPTHQSRPLPPT